MSEGEGAEGGGGGVGSTYLFFGLGTWALAYALGLHVVHRRSGNLTSVSGVGA